MIIEQQFLEKLRDLPPEKQKDVLDFVDFLKEKNGPKNPRRSLPGLWSVPAAPVNSSTCACNSSHTSTIGSGTSTNNSRLPSTSHFGLDLSCIP